MIAAVGADTKLWIALVGGREVGRFFTRVVAQSSAVLASPRGCEHSLHLVRNNLTDEEWVGRRDSAGSWHWTRTKAPHGEEPEEAPQPLRRFRADIDG